MQEEETIKQELLLHDDDEMKKLAEITKAKLKLAGLKTPDVSTKPIEKPFNKIKA